MAILRGFLKILVLKELGESRKSGYDLMKSLQIRTGSKPSPGSIYPLLEQLREQKWITEKGNGRSKQYELTNEGKEQLSIIDQKRNECLCSFIEGMKMLSALTGEDMQFPIAMVESLKRGELPFKEINPEWELLKSKLFGLFEQKKLKQHAPKIKKILKKSVQELQDL